MQEKLVLLVDCRLLLFWRHNQLVDWVVRLGDDRKREGGRHRAFLLRLLRLGRRTPSRHRLAAHEYEAAILRAPADSSPPQVEEEPHLAITNSEFDQSGWRA